TALFSVNAGNIILTNVNNDFSNFVVASGNDVSVTDANDLNLVASTVLGNLTLTTTGAITQTGAIIANGVGKTTTLDSGTGNITLDTTANDFNIISVAHAGAVSLQDVNDLAIGSALSQSFAATIGGNLTTSGLIKTAGGNVNLASTQAGTITVGASGIQTSLDQLSPGGSISITAANTDDLLSSVIINGVLDTSGGSGGILTLGGGVELNASPILGVGNITLDGGSHSQFFGNLTFTSAQIIAISNADLIINGPITSTGIGSNLTFIADDNNTGLGGVRVTGTGSVNSSGNLTLQGSNLFANSGVSVELQSGSSLIAAGTISLLGNISDSNIIVNGPVQSTGASQAITITPTGAGLIQLGSNLTTNGGAINLSNNTQLINNLTLKTNGGLITANAISGVGQAITFDVGSSNLILNAANNNFGTVAITSGNNIEINNLGAIDFGTSVITGTLGVTSSGNITDSGDISVGGTTTLTANNNSSITLDQANNDFSTLAIMNAGDVLIQDANAIDLGPFDISGNLSVIANGAITQSGGRLLVNDANKRATFSAGIANDITLNNASNDFTSIAITSGNNVSLQDINNLDLAGINLAGDLSITANGDITQSDAIIQNGLNSLTTLAVGTTHNISLANSANNIDNLIISSANDVTFNNSDNINFGSSTISGNLTARAIGAISETDPLTVAGNSSFDATASILLTQANQFTGSVLLTNVGNNNVAVTNNGLLTIGPTTSSLGSGTLTLTSVGITQLGAITQVPNAGAVSINAGAGAINLANAGNSLTGAVSLNNSGNNNVNLSNSIALAIGASNVGSGTMALTAGGSITETGAIVQAANAGTVTLSVTAPNSDILLASQPNDFTGAVVYGGTLSNIRDLGRRNIHINAGFTSTNIDLLTSLRNLTIIFDNAGIFAPAFTLHDGGNLYADTSGSLTGGIGGNIIQLGAVVVPGTVTLLAGNHSIIVNQNNTIGGSVFLNNSGNNNVVFTNSSPLTIGSANVGSGTLTLTGLGISQTGAIIQAAGAGAATINAGAGAINLNDAGNNFTGSVSLNNSGNNNISLTNSLALALGASNVGAGTLSLIAGGTISETGAIIQGPNAGTVTLSVTAPNSDILLASQAN
ncbi:MAG: beta strand repeat-containing protein, partial [Gammaproteobacteria bacterium]